MYMQQSWYTDRSLSTLQTLGRSVTNDVYISFGFAYDLRSISRKEVGERTMLENALNHLSRS